MNFDLDRLLRRIDLGATFKGLVVSSAFAAVYLLAAWGWGQLGVDAIAVALLVVMVVGLIVAGREPRKPRD